MIHDSVLGTVRDTWLVELRRLRGNAPGRLLGAVAAPGTSPATADALALRCVEDLERTGALARGGALVASGATFGASVAMVAAARGLACVVALDDRASRDERSRVAAYGADVRVVPGGSDEDGSAAAAAARRIAAETPGAVLVERRRERPGGGDVHAARELLAAAGEPLHALVGTERDAVTLDALRAALAASGSRALVALLAFDGRAFGGDAAGAPLVVSERDALATARRLAREEGVLVGAAHGGAALAAALRLAATAPAGAVVVALLPAASRKDLRTAYDAAWWDEHHGDGPAALTAGDVLRRKEGGPGELVTLPGDATVAEAIRIMRDLEVSQIPVVDAGRVVGTVREDQVIDLLLHAAERKDGPVADVMEDALAEIGEGASVEDLQALLVRGASAVLVRRAGGALDILTKYDLIHALDRGPAPSQERR